MPSAPRRTCSRRPLLAPNKAGLLTLSRHPRPLPDERVISGPSTMWRLTGLDRSQWRNRAGFTPASHGERALAALLVFPVWWRRNELWRAVQLDLPRARARASVRPCKENRLHPFDLSPPSRC